MSPNICIIGAGMAGLCSAKHCLENNFNVTIYEQTNKIGGTWVYTDEIGQDEFGLNIHSSMYKSLRTNLPKEIMGFPDFPMPEQPDSYIPACDVLEFLNLFAEHFNLHKYIQFQHYVVSVKPSDSKWEVITKYLPKNDTLVQVFDYIMVCNGHFHTPFIPEYFGRENFKGIQLHSHYYRSPEKISGKKILVFGAGPSGIDITNELKNFGKSVTLSYHNPSKLSFLRNVNLKPDIKQFRTNEVEFVDGTISSFDTIIYCTGFKYTFPFLHKSCGVFVDDNYVQPLWKQIINIENPTMAFIGLPFKSQISQMMDLQVRFVMKFFTKQKKCPSKENMYENLTNEMNLRWKNGLKKRHAHMLGNDFRNKYFCDLAKTAEIDDIKPVFKKLFDKHHERVQEDFENFRKDVYRIVDDENFIKIN